jgi:hypothetical protein
MGLSIHYSGKLKEATTLPNLIEEVKDIAKIYGWKYHIFEYNFPNDKFENKELFKNIYGISFTPQGCETISLTFLSNGTMICPTRVKFWANSEDEKKKAYIYTVSVKTQFAGLQTHQLIITLFRYLNKKYFCDFEMRDESDYWETNDEDCMRAQFKKYGALLDNFSLALETFPINDGESFMSYIERMAEQVNKLDKKTE